MKTHLREILIYYNPDSNSHRMTVAHAQSMVSHVRTFPFGQTPSTAASWQSILNAIGRPPKELLNKAHPYYQENIRGREFSNSNWIKILRYNPELLKAPIAIRGTRAILCENPTDIYKLEEPAPIV
jgi:arsenate reductase (glutaredoxin)